MFHIYNVCFCDGQETLSVCVSKPPQQTEGAEGGWVPVHGWATCSLGQSRDLAPWKQGMVSHVVCPKAANFNCPATTYQKTMRQTLWCLLGHKVVGLGVYLIPLWMRLHLWEDSKRPWPYKKVTGVQFCGSLLCATAGSLTERSPRTITERISTHWEDITWSTGWWAYFCLVSSENLIECGKRSTSHIATGRDGILKLV